MSRRKEEFYCDTSGGGCGKYFLTYLRSNMTGNYTVECPGCGHQHFRYIKEGVVTNDRHHIRAGSAEVIAGLRSTLRSQPWHTELSFRNRFLSLVGLGQ